MSIKVIALDIEGTLVTSVDKLYPRPFLYEFLVFCYLNFEKVVVFTLLSEDQAHSVVRFLVEGGHAPQQFLEQFEYVHCDKPYKDIQCVVGAEIDEVLLVDDTPRNIIAEQQSQWISIPSFNPLRENRYFAFSDEIATPKLGTDNALLLVQKKIQQICNL